MESANNHYEREPHSESSAVKKSPTSKMALFSLIFGIVSVVFCLSPLIQLPLGITAITLAYVARQQGIRNGQTVVGMAAGILAVILSLVIFGMIIYVYQVLLNDPVLGPVYNDMYRQIMDYWGQLPA
ncbi:DUF4190 domain-containing protein [Lachnospiraceae bacterium 62-35]